MDSDVKQLELLHEHKLSESQRAMSKGHSTFREASRVVEPLRRAVANGHESKFVRGVGRAIR